MIYAYYKHNTYNTHTHTHPPVICPLYTEYIHSTYMWGGGDERECCYDLSARDRKVFIAVHYLLSFIFQLFILLIIVIITVITVIIITPLLLTFNNNIYPPDISGCGFISPTYLQYVLYCIFHRLVPGRPAAAKHVGVAVEWRPRARNSASSSYYTACTYTYTPNTYHITHPPYI